MREGCGSGALPNSVLNPSMNVLKRAPNRLSWYHCLMLESGTWSVPLSPMTRRFKVGLGGAVSSKEAGGSSVPCEALRGARSQGIWAVRCAVGCKES